MVTTPGSSIVSAASRPLAVEHVWHTHCFSFIFSALPPQALQTLLPHHFPAGYLEPVPQVSTDAKARFHSRTFKVNSSISAWSCPFYLSKEGHVPCWKWVHCSVSNTVFSARFSMGASKHLSLTTPHLTSGKHNQQTPCWMETIEGMFFLSTSDQIVQTG